MIAPVMTAITMTTSATIARLYTCPTGWCEKIVSVGTWVISVGEGEEVAVDVPGVGKEVVIEGFGF